MSKVLKNMKNMKKVDKILTLKNYERQIVLKYKNLHYTKKKNDECWVFDNDYF